MDISSQVIFYIYILARQVHYIRSDNLFLLALAAINSSGYKIDELQSKTGLISFEAENLSFLISVTELDENSSMLKITPMINSYHFSPTIIENIFLYMTNNIK